MSETKKSTLVIVTGYSGAGLTTALNALQDSGMYCIDNIPIEMIMPTFELLEKQDLGSLSGFGMGVHIHKNFDTNEFHKVIAKLAITTDLDILCLTADTHVLNRRYNASRRPHPLVELGISLNEAITLEKKYINSVVKKSNIVIDTSSLSPHQLKRMVENRYESKEFGRILNVSIISFGFKHGQYKPLDNLYDVRFLDNPYFEKELKEKTGLDDEIVEYFKNSEITQEFIKRLEDWLLWLFPNYFSEGKHYLRIGIGCTGGKHRSVYIAQKIGEILMNKNLNYIRINTSHADIDKP